MPALHRTTRGQAEGDEKGSYEKLAWDPTRIPVIVEGIII